MSAVAPGSDIAEGYRLRFEAMMACWKDAKPERSAPMCRSLIFDPGTPDLYLAWSHLILAMTDDGTDNNLYHAFQAELLMGRLKDQNPGNGKHMRDWEFSQRVLEAAKLDEEEFGQDTEEEEKEKEAEHKSLQDLPQAKEASGLLNEMMESIPDAGDLPGIATQQQAMANDVPGAVVSGSAIQDDASQPRKSKDEGKKK